MSRSITGWVLLGTLVGGSGPAGWSQEKAEAPFSHREIRAPKGFVTHVAFSPDGKLMAGGSAATVVVWNVADGKEVQRMQLPEKQVYHSVVFAADGKTLIWIGGGDPKVRIFDIKTGKQLREFDQPNGQKRGTFSTYFIAYSPDGKRMAFHGANFFKGLDIVDVATGKVELQLGAVADCRGCAFSNDGKLIATHASNGGIHVWDAVKGTMLQELRDNNRAAGAAYTFVAFSPDAKFLASSGHIDNAVSVWSLRTGKLATSVTDKWFFRTAFFSDDSLSLLCVSDANGQAFLHNLVAEKAIYHFNPPPRLAHFAAFAPDCKRVAVIGPSSEGGESSIYGQFSIFLYEVPAKALSPVTAQVDETTLEKLWPELSSDNDLRLQLVLKAFRAAPKPTVELFGKKVPPVSKELREKVEKAIAELDDDAFTKRDQAMKDLQSLAHQFAPLLEAKMKAAAAGEIRNRLTFILKQMGEEKQPASLVMELRALNLLEQIGTKEARDLVERLSHGAAQARLTVEAQAVLERMAKSKSRRPEL